MNERIREIAQRAGFIDIPAGNTDIADQFYDFKPPNKDWLRRLLAAPNLSTAGHISTSSESLSVSFLDSCNDKIQQFLKEGFYIVFINDKFYQVLDPSSQSLVRFHKNELYKQNSFPQSFPAMRGPLSAKIEAANGTNYAYITVTCGKIGTTSQFHRKDVVNSPALYAVSPDQGNSQSLVIFGQLSRNRFVRSKAA